ncbi:hypothetical protein QBC43DRAFT_128083 [Cladorrhinum sp. PSN259]|nr:hypothetical protein QBC43DRAFT_128083 [Cladorrhinum sp. PSN259]
MDVTSLLNVSCAGGGLGVQRRDSIASSTPSATGDTTATSTAVPTPSPERDQSRGRSGSNSPTRTRNRTPWDAGGYSLPLTIDTKSIPSPAEARPAFMDDSPTEGSHTSLVSPVSQGAHKLSASRSSLSSSYSSSSYSGTNHSRISSLSTVSESGSFPHSSNNSNSTNCYQPSSTPYSKHQRFYSQQLTYPGAQIDNTASMADRRSTGRNQDIGPCFTMVNNNTPPGREQDNTQRFASSGHSSRSNSIAVPMRAGSPSDAVIIRRGNSGSGEPSPVDGNSGSDVNGAVDITREVDVHSKSQASQSQSPHIQPADFEQPGAIAAYTAQVNDVPPFADRVYGPESPSNIDKGPLYLDRTLVNLVIGPPDQQFPYNSHSDLWRLVDFRHDRFCVFKLDCRINEDPTKANWRKGMSHVFGRNKNETRAIPNNVWVHFCRKHYQRARYRNDEGYLRRIIYMIIAQILRVEAWSNHNLEVGQPERGQLKGWTLHLRKRESDKRSKATDGAKTASDSGRGLKRKAFELDHEIDEDDIPAEGEDDMLSSNRVMVTLPDWLLALCTRAPGEEPVIHKSAEIIRFIQRLFEDLRPMGKGDLPDFEILPVIQGETAKSKAKAAKGKSKSVGRRQSVGDSLREKHRAQDEDRGDVDEGMRFSREDYKRPRIMPNQSQTQYPPRTMMRTVPEVRPIVYPERVQGDWNATAGSRANRSGSLDHPGSTGPLPTPLGYRDQDVRNNSHQRSVSDAGNAGYWPTQQPVTSSYPAYNSYQTTDGYSGYPITQDRQRNGNYPMYSQQYQQSWDKWQTPGYGQAGYGSAMTGNHAKHVRHQSTPVTSRSISAYAQPGLSSTSHGVPMATNFSQTRYDGTQSMGGYYDHQSYDHQPENASAYQPVGGHAYSNSYASVGGGDLPSVSRPVDRTYSQADYSTQQPVAPMTSRAVDSRSYQTAADGYQDFSNMQPTIARGNDNSGLFPKTEVDQFSRRV